MGRKLIDTYHPEPEDTSAADALQDDLYYKAMVRYGLELQQLFDPIWKEKYLKRSSAPSRAHAEPETCHSGH